MKNKILWILLLFININNNLIYCHEENYVENYNVDQDEIGNNPLDNQKNHSDLKTKDRDDESTQESDDEDHKNNQYQYNNDQLPFNGLPPEENKQNEITNKDSKKKSSNIILLLGGGLIIGVIVWIIKNKKKNKEQEDNKRKLININNNISSLENNPHDNLMQYLQSRLDHVNQFNNEETLKNTL